LSHYLRRISGGEYSLDIRDNKEGELSILKNEIYKVTLMLLEYNEQLKREKRLLSEQMADISHQLKTPLTSMVVMVDLLRDENLPHEKRREFISRIDAQLERIEWLVSSLLKMSKLDAGVVEMKPSQNSGWVIIEKALDPLLIPMELKDITYSVKGQNETITCDLHWTVEALINILKNCIEHTPRGGKIDISINDNPLYSEIIISDSGEGISKEDLPHILPVFTRGKMHLRIASELAWPWQKA
jgi:His Kinase A (phosphoacceptor) domain./Histidine kinase-, DNA gyrase B-, and HSP90-like ATPase.